MERNPHGLSPHLHVGAGCEHAEDVHCEIVEDVLVFRAEAVDSVQDNNLDVVVRFFLHELDERLGGGCGGHEINSERMSGGKYLLQLLDFVQGS